MKFTALEFASLPAARTGLGMAVLDYARMQPLTSIRICYSGRMEKGWVQYSLVQEIRTHDPQRPVVKKRRKGQAGEGESLVLPTPAIRAQA